MTPDILTCAKGLGAGYQPIAAVLVGTRIYDAVAAGSGAFVNGYTYVGHAAACAAALAVQRAIEDEDLLANVRRQGEALRAALVERFGDHEHVGDIRGRGLFQALEFVADRTSKATFDPGCKLHAQIKAEAMSRGLMWFSERWHRRRLARRPCPARTALHHPGGPCRGDRRQAGGLRLSLNRGPDAGLARRGLGPPRRPQRAGKAA